MHWELPRPTLRWFTVVLYPVWERWPKISVFNPDRFFKRRNINFGPGDQTFQDQNFHDSCPVDRTAGGMIARWQKSIKLIRQQNVCRLATIIYRTFPTQGCSVAVLDRWRQLTRRTTGELLSAIIYTYFTRVLSSQRRKPLTRAFRLLAYRSCSHIAETRLVWTTVILNPNP